MVCTTVTVAAPVPTFEIRGEKGMSGTIEVLDNLLWHIKSPVVLDVWYGAKTHIPATWVDPDTGKDGMAVYIPSDGTVHLDKSLSGGPGEIVLPVSAVTFDKPGGDRVTGRIIILPTKPVISTLIVAPHPTNPGVVILSWYQTITGTITITIDGVVWHSGSYSAGNNTGVITGVTVGSHNVCVEAT